MTSKNLQLKLILCLIMGLSSLHLSAQESIHTSGGEATGSGGKVSSSVGQVSYQYLVGSNGSISEGVQQPFEIWVTSVNDMANISLNVEAYPNPTIGQLWLTIESFENSNLVFSVYDFNGRLLQSAKIENTKTLISLDDYAAATYFLRLRSADSEIKTFKIIKN